MNIFALATMIIMIWHNDHSHWRAAFLAATLITSIIAFLQWVFGTYTTMKGADKRKIHEKDIRRTR